MSFRAADNEFGNDLMLRVGANNVGGAVQAD
jgi:hypothetical protein